MSEAAKKDPMHGKTLKAMLTELVDKYGWEELAAKISINCFANDPSLSSSLKFLRKTPWARRKVEIAYMELIGMEPPTRKKPSPRPAAPREADRPKTNPWTGKPF
ncbi:DUF2132 domain-containing protein [Pelagicoccus sp. NFK12]|uniref:DUF2132 domain-containing protein n=1 Tax=Pelagicoccus enzymogenes TaxID=2773457 RepID=A0A927IIT0_9BACT|nr:VF530 family protein [Pelagicoccus enzymogenes]MBD5781154.1 DUF2132 domain-containing protein [Pelagicoccus enzymogenes]